MSELIKTRPPVEPQQYISVEEAVDEYPNYYLTVNHDADNVEVWCQDYGSTPVLDRSFKLSGFREVVDWLTDARVDEERDEPDLGRWTKWPDQECYLLLPCGDSIETSVEKMRQLAAALLMMSSVSEWSGVE